MERKERYQDVSSDTKMMGGRTLGNLNLGFVFVRTLPMTSHPKANWLHKSLSKHFFHLSSTANNNSSLGLNRLISQKISHHRRCGTKRKL